MAKKRVRGRSRASRALAKEFPSRRRHLLAVLGITLFSLAVFLALISPSQQLSGYAVISGGQTFDQRVAGGIDGLRSGSTCSTKRPDDLVMGPETQYDVRSSVFRIGSTVVDLDPALCHSRLELLSLVRKCEVAGPRSRLTAKTYCGDTAARQGYCAFTRRLAQMSSTRRTRSTDRGGTTQDQRDYQCAFFIPLHQKR